MFRIEMLPAAHGDCLWIEYGEGGVVHRVLIDGGPAHTYPALYARMLALPPAERTFELLVITHIDADHIEGAVRLLQDAEALQCRFERIWFNGWSQLNAVPDPAGEPLGAVQGEYLSLLIADYEARTGGRAWNAGFPGGYVAAGAAVEPLPGGLRLTVLSPDPLRLLALKDKWEDELREARVVHGDEATLRRKLRENRRLKPLGDVLGGEPDEPLEERWELPDADGRDLADDLDDSLGGESAEPGANAAFGRDTSLANGSSIALLAEHPADRPAVRVLLAGDAWASVLAASIAGLAGPAGRLALDAFKIPHHGSVGNLTEGLLSRLACRHYLISTSGARFRHPHRRAIDLLLAQHPADLGPASLHFNYLTETTSPWADPADPGGRGYRSAHASGAPLELP